MWLLFDVLMDGEYRPLWDSYMVESFTLGYINPNNDIGYYASKCFASVIKLQKRSRQIIRKAKFIAFIN